jgi:hypothetical protein
MKNLENINSSTGKPHATGKLLTSISNSKNPQLNTNKLENSKESIYYIKYYNKYKGNKKEFRIFLYFKLDNYSIYVIGIEKRNQDKPYKKETKQNLNENTLPTKVR